MLCRGSRKEKFGFASMDKKMAALNASCTWKFVALPHGKKAIGCKWIYKIKHNVNGCVSSYKVMLITKGYAQNYGMDYEETFSPVARMAIVRAVITMATTKGHCTKWMS